MKRLVSKYLKCPAVFLFALCLLPFALFSQGEKFGKNRVQFHKTADEWMLYETANFVTYWFGDARPIAHVAMQMGEMDFDDLQSLLEHPLSEKIELIVYHDLTDFKTSNIGSDDESGARDAFGRPLFELAYSGGQVISQEVKTRVAGNKIFVHFDGNHLHLRAQIREGVAAVMLNSMLFGANFQEIVQNAVLLDLPIWFTDGIVAWCGDEWNPELDNQLRDILASGKFKTFDRLARAYPRLAGHAMWHYIGLQWGRQTVSNLLYLTRINRSVDSGFLYVLGGSYKRTSDAALQFFKKRYADDAKNTVAPDAADLFKMKNRKRLPLSQVKLSPDGKRMIWVTNDLGKWRIKLHDFEKETTRTIAKGSSRNALQGTDFNYPLVAWNPNNQSLAVLFEQRDVLKLIHFDLLSSKKTYDKLPGDYQRIFSMAFSSPTELLFSAMQKGQSDLFIYRTVNRSTERLTNDFYDDLDAAVVFSGEKKGVLWASNRRSDTLATARLDSILPLGRLDIFFYDLQKRGSELVRITNTPLVDERQPIGLDSTNFSYLSNESGIFNRQNGYLEDYLAFHRQTFFKKNGEEIILEGPFQPTENVFQKVENAWRKMADDETGSFKFQPLKTDSTLKKALPKSAETDSVRLVEVWKKRSFTWNQTNYDRHIQEQSVASRAGRLAEIVWRNGRYQIYLKQIEPRKAQAARLTKFRQNQFALLGLNLPKTEAANDSFSIEKPVGSSVDSSKNSAFSIPNSVFENGWKFQAPFPDEPPVVVQKKPQVPDNQELEIIELKEDGTPKKKSSVGLKVPPRPVLTSKVVRFNPSRIVPYRLKFRTAQLSTTVDNSLLFEGLDSYAGTPGGFRTPPSGLLCKGVFTDLFEDYTLEGGFRVPVSFNGAEYFLLFDNKKRRLDRRIAFYRKTMQITDEQPDPGHTHGTLPEPHRSRIKTMLGQYEVRWPLDIYTSFRAQATVRQDRSFELTTDQLSLDEKALVEQRAGLRLSAVFDNTIDIDLNLRTGSRAKIWVESVKKFALNPERRSLKFSEGFMTVIGLDARHYQRLDRRSIFATRLAGATSFGSERMLYFLGGVDQWLFPKFNDKIPLPTGDDFAYQTLASNLRGFRQNIRNGNSFLLINNELRIPVFKYFTMKPTLATFWRNFQIVGFFDAGTAWQGKNPYAGDNPINTIYLENPPTVEVKVNYFRDPLVAGYGVGLRSTILGFFLRIDYGWGIETRQVQRPMWHLALGTDF